MRIFHWEAYDNSKVIADGYLLAKDREEAEKKTALVPFTDVRFDDDDCGYHGVMVTNDGIALRWED